MKLHPTIVPLAAVWLLSVPAFATGAADQAAAEALFNEAKKLVSAGDFEHACPKFAESNRLDPGSGTLLNLGACYEQIGKLASAWGAFNEAAVTARNAGDASRQDEATRRAAALAPRLSKLSVLVAPAVRGLKGLQIKRDGEAVGEGQWGSPIPIDSGEHVIEASAPGRRTWTTKITITGPGATATEVPPLVEAPTEVPPSAADTPVTTGAAPFWRPQRVIGLTLGAAGLVGFGVSAGFGVNAATKNTQSRLHCLPTDQNACDQTGVDLRNQAYSASYISTGMAVGGGTLLAAGVILFLTTPREAPPKASASTAYTQLQPMLGPGLAGLALGGVW
jgi:hypothetical protein